MVFISKNDKKLWQFYIDNFENFTLNINKGELKKEVKIKEKNFTKKNNIASSYKLLKKGKIKPDGVIDLHGYSLKMAKQNLETYILKSYENNFRNILVITGKGLNNQGVLKKEVPVWLEEKKIKNYLISFEKAPNTNGGSGALLLRIRNKYKF
jgi:DNA-nicking Smr family endonuclease